MRPRRDSSPGAVSRTGATEQRGDERILYVTPGYRLIALNAKTGVPVPGFGAERRRRSEGSGSTRTSIRHRRESRPARHADRRQERRDRRRGIRDRREPEEPEQRQGRRPRLRRPNGQAAVAVPHHPAARRSSATTRGRRTRGPYTGNTGVWTQISVDEELGLAYLPVELPTTTTTAAIGPATRCSARASSPSICRPDSANGITSWSTTASGTWTSRARRSWPTSRSTASRSRPSRSRPSRDSSTCSIA